MSLSRFMRRKSFLILILCLAGSAWAQTDSGDSPPDIAPDRQDTRPSAVPDIREDESLLTLKDGDFVVVPIPMSGPTLGTGLIAGAAYFYPQTETEKKVEPASVSGLGAMYTSNDSKAVALFHQGYWSQNRWRVTAGVGAADVNVVLRQPDEETGVGQADWNVAGEFIYARLSRKMAGRWYAGVFLRSLFARQNIVSDVDFDSDFDIDDVRTVGLGLLAEYDSRDMPINSYTGIHFEAQGLFNDKALGSQQTYQSYSAKFRSYHQLRDNLVFAWEIQTCRRVGTIPLWDACRIPLRGFSAFDYLGKVSFAGEGSLRWQMSKRWGMVGFAGGGNVAESYSGLDEDRSIPSYGLGIRFGVLPAKRINLRVDYAWSRDDSALHIGVAEYF